VTQEIESVKPILTVIDDEGDLVVSSTGSRGKEMAQAILALANGSRKVVVIFDGEMKVMKRGAAAQAKGTTRQVVDGNAAAQAMPVGKQPDPVPGIQDQFAADLEAGVTGEAAMGEQPTPTPGPSDPVAVPAAPKTPARRKPQIFQDAAAPPAPELAEAEMDRLLAEAAAAEQESARLAEQQRFQSQQAVQAGDQSAPIEAEAPATPRKRTRERTLATTGRPCGRCGGGGQIVGEAGFTGACPVCLGQGQIKSWDRSLKVR
jgi:hypothetical protein